MKRGRNGTAFVRAEVSAFFQILQKKLFNSFYSIRSIHLNGKSIIWSSEFKLFRNKSLYPLI